MERQLNIPFVDREAMHFDNFLAASDAQREAVSFFTDRWWKVDQPATCVLVGPTGCGKTHLGHAWLHAAVNAQRHVLALNCVLRHMPEEQAMSQLTALCTGVDAIFVDDLENYLGNKAYESGLFALYNALSKSQRLLVTASAPLAELSFALPDLRSRLSQGVSLQIGRPEEDNLPAVVTMMAERYGMQISSAGVQFLLTHISRDLTSIQSLFQKLMNLPAARHSSHITIPLLKQVL